jgi:hypothetical protein
LNRCRYWYLTLANRYDFDGAEQRRIADRLEFQMRITIGGRRNVLESSPSGLKRSEDGAGSRKQLPLGLTKMRRLGCLVAVKNNKEYTTSNNYQNPADKNQFRGH